MINSMIPINTSHQKEYYLKIGENIIEGKTRESLVGINELISTGSTQSVRDQGGLYVFPTSASNFYISSSSASDTNYSVLLTLLDINYNIFKVIVTTNGQTPVLVSGGQYFRLNGAIGINPVSNQGNIYISTTNAVTGGVPNDVTKILGKIPIGENTIHNGIYTVPAGYTAFVQTVSIYIGKGNDAKVYIYITPFGLSPIKNISYPIYETIFQDIFPTPSRIEGKTDIDIRMKAGSNNIDVTFNTQFILIKN